MRRSSRLCPLAANLLGLLLICGCRQPQPCCTNWDYSASYTSAPVTAPGPVVHTVNKPTSGTPSTPQALVISAAPMLNASAAGLRFAHDAEYHQLSGTLAYSHVQGAWLLRYAPFNEEDRYGGVVTLTEDALLNGFKTGQAIRVEGELIDPGSRQLRPAFRVHSLAPAVP
jgi:hypothetical protein